MADNKNGIIQNAAANTSMENKKASPKSLKDWVSNMSGEIAKALPSVLTPERFTRMMTTALSSNKKLQQCTPQSFVGAMMTAAQLGLEPNTALGQAYIIPYNNHGVMEATFQLGYKGVLDLAYRSGEVSTIQAHTVYENDTFEYELGLDPKLKHIPAKKDRGAPTWFYAVFKTKSGGFGFEVMSVEDARAHGRKYSKSFSRGPWQTDFEAMALKTVLKKALKYAPLASDFVRGVAQDETIHNTLSENMADEPLAYVEDDDDFDNGSADGAVDGVVEPATEAPAVDVDPETGEIKGMN
nr:MAG TPA: RecT protein [Bacteriophage sp.]